ncbi:MAG: transcription antitermination factor NusB, partial [bacterium]
MSPQRAVTLALLQAVARGRRLDVAWAEVAPDLNPRRRRWVQEAAFGTVRVKGRLDHLLERHVDRGLSSLPPPLVPILRLGAYELLYMDSVPDHAAVSQTVESARQVVGEGLARLANGVLRSLLREGGGEERFPSLHEEPVQHLATWGSHPEWLVRRWVERYGV